MLVTFPIHVCKKVTNVILVQEVFDSFNFVLMLLMVLNSDDFVTCLITSAYEPIFLALKKLKSLIIVDVSMESATLIVIIYFDDLFEGFKK